MFQGKNALTASESFECSRWDEGVTRTLQDVIANETPVALIYNCCPHVVMMATPSDIDDFVLGFSLSEGIIKSLDELLAVRSQHLPDGIVVRISIPHGRMLDLANRPRNLTGRTGCGLCGAQTLAQAVRRPSAVASTFRFSSQSLQRGILNLTAHQPLNASTGAMHAAAWMDVEGRICRVREDVGRHNALDKLVGAMVTANDDISAGVALITSRASYEMVQKAATLRMQVLCAVSAPTALAIRLAQDAGVTLIAFARSGRHTVYTHAERVTDSILPNSLKILESATAGEASDALPFCGARASSLPHNFVLEEEHI